MSAPDARPNLLVDDGAARHLRKGLRLPDVALPAISGKPVSLAKLAGLTVAFFYPWTGRPGAPNPPHWDDIPGAHGSTPQAEGFRNLEIAFAELGVKIVGVSTQASDYQREFAGRLGLRYDLLSDANFELQKALGLPTFETGDVTYLKRLTLVIRDGAILRVYYPIAQPAAHARDVCAAIGMSDRRH
ncbi:MAG: peroxiredoxin [Hyphomicrobiales bacterium]|nr:MAG: peroxiredoxin [Hyphomicrobiales bacterium]